MLSRLLRDRRRGVAADRRPLAPRSRRSRPCLEGLEARTLLTGTWSALTNAPPGIISTMYLLTDGTVMAQAGNQASSTWYALTPDASGSYANGTWSSLQSMHDTRFAYSADVLPNGHLFVYGAEYGTGGSTAETYNPVANTWTAAPAQTFGSLLDASGKLLGNGTVLISPVQPNTPGQTIVWNPATKAWSAGPQLYRNGSADEQSWVFMPDGSILAVDGHSTSERYVPGQNAWVNDASVPVDLVSSGAVAGEIGAGTLLPDGRVFQIGATGHTAFYTPSAQPGQMGTWSAGPDLPNGRGAYDTPAAVEPNGKVLIVTSELGLSGTAQFVEFDPATNSYAQVAAPAPQPPSAVAYGSRFLDLPDGTILYTNNYTDGGAGYGVYIYTPDGAPQDAWRPTIASISPNADGSYLATGTLFNGLDEGAAYGDDAQMSSNYPLVRLTDAAGNVTFARTFGWNQAVATGSTTVSTRFTLPAGIAPGDYQLSVVANGIASNSVAFHVSPLVTNSNDSGTGSLRQAILNANAASGLQTINFAIGSGPQTIHLTSALPALTNSIVLDATTQPGYTGTPLITLDGSAAGAGTSGLVVMAKNCTVRGFIIDGFSADGVELSGSSASGDTIAGNILGTDAASAPGKGNGQRGVSVLGGASNDTIGGTAPGAGNVLSGNGWDGISLYGQGTSGIVVEGNKIGTDVTGTQPLGNGDRGISVFGGASDNTIGGTASGARNVIASNGWDGVGLSDSGTSGNLILGNAIGTDASGALSLGNKENGVVVFGAASSTTIGGTAPGAGNTIEHNQWAGVALGPDSANPPAYPTGIAILSNAIASNVGLGIDLSPSGVNPIVPGGPHAGPNGLPNYPLLNQAVTTVSGTVIQATLSAVPSTSYLIQFFTGTAADPSGHGQGPSFLGSTSVTTDNQGNAAFGVVLPTAIPAGQFVTATGTGPSGTSEFSADLVASPGLILDNRSSAYSKTGSWTNSGPLTSPPGAFAGDYDFAAPSSTASSSASWTTTGLPTGAYDVEVTWGAGTNRATNAPYQVYDGNTLLATVLVNQQQAPLGLSYGGVRFQSLGVLHVQSGTLRVVLTNKANGYVIADAVRIAVPPSLPAVADDTDPGYSQTGTWTTASGYGGYGNEYLYAAGVSGAATATASWTTAGLAPGAYDVEVTWGAGTNRASNAAYQVYDGSTLLATIPVNQKLAPAGPAAGGVPFQSLGVFSVTSGTLRVVLGNSANGYVVADAVRIASVSVVDDGGAGYSQTGTWTSASGYGGYNGEYRYAAGVSGTATATASWTASGLAPAFYDVEVTWGAGTNRATNAPYQVYDGNTLVATVLVNQQQAPLGRSAGGVAFQSLGVFNVASGTLRVVVGNNANGFVVADAALIAAPIAVPAIADDGGPGYSQTGAWTSASGYGGYNNVYRYAAGVSGPATATASWTTAGLAPGSYDVEVTWGAGTNRATNAPYQVYDGNTLLATVTVNQQLAPSGPSAGGVAFQSLGQFRVTSGTLRVVLGNSANGYVVADAVRIAAPSALARRNARSL